MEAKITVELWESEIQAEPFHGDWELGNSTVKSEGGGEGSDLPPSPVLVMHLKEWTLLKWLK